MLDLPSWGVGKEGGLSAASLGEAQIMHRITSSSQDRSPRGLASTVRNLIREGELSPGTKLPTVRSLASRLHVSASTMSEAWGLLAKEGLIHGAGRHGTVVLREREVQTTRRLGQMTWVVGRHELDLSTGTPDSSLLPTLAEAMTGIEIAAVKNYQGPNILPELEDVLRVDWPSGAPLTMTMMHGAYDAIDRVFTQVLSVGDRVLVEEPTTPAVADLVEAQGAVPIAVSLDDQGVIPSSLQAGLLTRPKALVIQPRAQNPLGIAMSPSRAEELATLLRGHKTLVIEDDHSGILSMSPLTSLFDWIPDRVVRILSFSKSHGPDLRLAAVSGPPRLMHEIELRRRIGGGWESRLIQQILLGLLLDSRAAESVEHARRVYHMRRREMAQALERVNVRTYGHDGLNLWVEVGNETTVMRRLAQADIGVCPGSPLTWSNPSRSFIRVTTAALEDGYDQIARIIADL